MSSAAPAQRNYLWPVLIAVVVLLGVVAVLAARSSSSDDEGGATDATGTAIGSQNQDVAVEGDPLPAATETEDPAVGQTIPAVVGADFSGEPVAIGPDDGAQLIMFVAHWCPHCQAEVPRVLSHLEDSPLPDDVRLVMVSTSVQSTADNYPPQSWLEGEGWEGDTLADSTEAGAAAAFGIGGFPYFVVTDASGQVVARTSGEITMDQFDQLVDLAAGTAG